MIIHRLHAIALGLQMPCKHLDAGLYLVRHLLVAECVRCGVTWTPMVEKR